jgi:hypothetical protein
MQNLPMVRLLGAIGRLSSIYDAKLPIPVRRGLFGSFRMQASPGTGTPHGEEGYALGSRRRLARLTST